MASEAMRERRRGWWILVPLIPALAVLVLLSRTRPPPEQVAVQERITAVRVIEVPRVTAVPRAVAHGNVEPSRTWEAVAQVAGQVVHMHPRLERGRLLEAGTEILRIDPTDYRLAVAQIQTSLQAARASLAQMAVEEANTRASLDIEEQALALGEQELDRRRRLLGQGTVTRSDFDAEQRKVLAQRQGVQSLRNAMALFPARRELIEAELARYRAQLESARLDLERTVMRLPFDARIARVDVETTQFVRQGEVVAVADGIDRAEVAAQLAIGQMRGLVRGERTLDLSTAAGGERAEQALAIQARVRLRHPGIDVEWGGRVARLREALDPRARTVGLIVEVDDPYRDVQPGVRPPLIKGLFVEVELRGRPRPDSLVIPRAALHGDTVHVAGPDDRLAHRTVEVDLFQPGYVVVASGLEAGERVVISDLLPAIEGMLLAPVDDADALAVLLDEVAGGAP